jgi:hypothetical protein
VRSLTLPLVASTGEAHVVERAAAVRRGDAPTRKELEAEARRLNIEGRSKMGKEELKRAVARAK